MRESDWSEGVASIVAAVKVVPAVIQITGMCNDARSFARLIY